MCWSCPGSSGVARSYHRGRCTHMDGPRDWTVTFAGLSLSTITASQRIKAVFIHFLTWASLCHLPFSLRHLLSPSTAAWLGLPSHRGSSWPHWVSPSQAYSLISISWSSSAFSKRPSQVYVPRGPESWSMVIYPTGRLISHHRLSAYSSTELSRWGLFREEEHKAFSQPTFRKWPLPCSLVPEVLLPSLCGLSTGSWPSHFRCGFTGSSPFSLWNTAYSYCCSPSPEHPEAASTPPPSLKEYIYSGNDTV